MKLLFVNPNSTQSMTDKVKQSALSVLPSGVEVIAVTNSAGPLSIQGAQDGELAVPGMLELIQTGIDNGVDGVVIACFDDTGLEAARALSDVPVVGIGQAAYHLSMLSGDTFSVVTTLSVSVPVLKANIEKFGVQPYCRNVRASEVPVLDLEHAGSDAEARISREIEVALASDKCEAIVLGCAGMTDLATRLSESHGVPVVDGVVAAAALIHGLALLKR